MARPPAPARGSGTLSEKRGSLFLSSGCNACHAIRGTAAAGVVGPGLTHAGSRISIAAATLPSTAETFSRWISGNRHIKPNDRMPPFGILSSGDLAALGAYFESLQ